jgi:hypothetical protein
MVTGHEQTKGHEGSDPSEPPLIGEGLRQGLGVVQPFENQPKLAERDEGVTEV